MTQPSTGRTLALWTFMLEHGGYWTAGELSRALGYEGVRIDGLLYQMAQRGFIVRKPRPDRVNGYRFGVTLQCKTPFGMTLEQVAAALRMLRPKEDVTPPGPPRTQWRFPVQAAA